MKTPLPYNTPPSKGFGEPMAATNPSASEQLPAALAKVGVSIFANAWGTTPTEVGLAAILRGIRDGRYVSEIARLRELLGVSREAYDRAKKKLPAFTVSGRTNGRTELVEHSNLLQADLDKLGAKLPELRARLKGDPYVAFGFLSPSGQGLKLGVAIDGSRPEESFCAAEAYFRRAYGVEIDPRCKDVGRLCFVSHDPELWTNAAAVPLALPEKGRVAPHSSESCILEGSAPAPLDNCVSDYLDKSEPMSLNLCNTPGIVLRNMVFRAKALKELEHTHSGLPGLYQKLVEARFEPEPGGRNGFVTKAVRFLYGAVAKPLVPVLVGCFYQCNRTLFNDSYEQHMKETQAMLENTARTYAESLAPAEHMIYDALPEQEQDVFRICRDLALLPNQKEGRLRFFLSCKELGDRLGGYPMQALRLFRLFKTYGLISQLKNGTQRAPGRKAEAAVYQWLLPDPGGAGAAPSGAETKAEAPIAQEVGR
jgi:hypothetical protein